jgi:hypothetical protein
VQGYEILPSISEYKPEEKGSEGELQAFNLNLTSDSGFLCCKTRWDESNLPVETIEVPRENILNELLILM